MTTAPRNVPTPAALTIGTNETGSVAGGMAPLVVTDGHGGWTTRPNPEHRGYAQR